MNYGDDVPFNRQHNLAGFVACVRRPVQLHNGVSGLFAFSKSTDGGKTWANATAVGTVFSGRFSAPV
jgi:hypothetical protein